MPAEDAPIDVCESAGIQTDAVTSEIAMNSNINLRALFFCIFSPFFSYH